MNTPQDTQTIQIKTATGSKTVQFISATFTSVLIHNENGPLYVPWMHVDWRDWPVCQRAIVLTSPRAGEVIERSN